MDSQRKIPVPLAGGDRDLRFIKAGLLDGSEDTEFSIMPQPDIAEINPERFPILHLHWPSPAPIQGVA